MALEGNHSETKTALSMLDDPTASILLSSRMPSSLLSMYTSLDSLSVVEQAGSDFVAFGRSGPICYLAVKPKTGSVFLVLPGDSLPAQLVNSSITTFLECVEKVKSMYPYYSAAADESTINQAADKLLSAFKEIDPSAVPEGSFWYNLVDDARMGDLSTELLAYFNDQQ